MMNEHGDGRPPITDPDRHDGFTEKPGAGDARGRHAPAPQLPGVGRAAQHGVVARDRGAERRSPIGEGRESAGASHADAQSPAPTTEAPRTWPPAPPAGPMLRAAAPGEPFYLPAANWRWGTAVAGLVVGAAPQALLTIASFFTVSSASESTAVSTGSVILLAISALILYGWEALAAWLFSLRQPGRSFILWGFRRPTRAYFWVVPVGLVAVYVFSMVHDLLVHPQEQAIVSDFPHSAIGATMFVLVAVIMAPLFEEIVFRGFLFRGLANSWGWAWGALVSAAIFGAAHLQLDVFLPLAALGFALAWAYKRTGSLWTCITMHALFNLIAVVAWVFTG